MKWWYQDLPNEMQRKMLAEIKFRGRRKWDLAFDSSPPPTSSEVMDEAERIWRQIGLDGVVPWHKIAIKNAGYA